MGRPRSQRHRSSIRQRRRHRFLDTAFLIAVLDEEEFAGSKRGCKNISRLRKDVEGMFMELGNHARKAYRMTPEAFLDLHSILEADLVAKFSKPNKDDSADRSAPNGIVSTKLRLSCTIRYFAGGEVLDLILSHGMGRTTIYDTVWKVVDVVNESPALSFNEGGAEFPTGREQEEIARGFLGKSTAGFTNVVGAVDGMLVWTILPDKEWCAEHNIGQTSFHCSRKDKYGWNLLAMCDHECKFRWANIKHPGRSSDYLSWRGSGLPAAIENGLIKLIAGGTMVGDNAFVKAEYMAVPFPGYGVTEVQDGYNFYLSQLRITIECAFGILVHRWGILRRPLSCRMDRVLGLTMCLMRLHNYCIDAGCGRVQR